MSSALYATDVVGDPSTLFNSKIMCAHFSSSSVFLKLQILIID